MTCLSPMQDPSTEGPTVTAAETAPERSSDRSRVTSIPAETPMTSTEAGNPAKPTSWGGVTSGSEVTSKVSGKPRASRSPAAICVTLPVASVTANSQTAQVPAGA